MCICMCIYTDVCIYICVCMYAYIYIYIDISIYSVVTPVARYVSTLQKARQPATATDLGGSLAMLVSLKP